MSDSGPAAGATFTLSATVRNAGDGAAAATKLRYYRSTDATITTADMAEGTAAVADESDTPNNCSASVTVEVEEPPATTYPDLEVGSPTVSDSSPVEGGSFTLSATVRNTGDGASAATTLRYYRSTDATITTADTAEGTAAVAGLAAAGSTSASVQLTAPSTAGTYYYGACVDAVADESDTTNNCSTFVQVDVSASPSFGEQFVVDEDIPEMPTGDWTPDVLSRASFSLVSGQIAIAFRHGGRVEEEGVTYTCMSSGGCAIEDTRVTMGIILVSESSAQADIMVAGVGELVDEKTVFQEKVYNGSELGDSTATLRSVAGETTRVSFLDPDGDLVFVDFSSDDPATEVVITLEGFTGTLEESPYDQPETRYARGLATVTIVNPTELTWLEVVSLGNHIDRVDLALIKEDTFDGEVDGMADLQAVVIEGEGSMGAIDATNANFVSSFGMIGIDAGGTIVKRALSIGDITPSEGTTPVLRISGDSLDPANAGEGETVIGEIRIAGGDFREATEQLQIDTAEVVYEFPIVAVEGELSIRDSELRPDLGDGKLDAVTNTFVADPDAYFFTDGQTTNSADTSE